MAFLDELTAYGDRVTVCTQDEKGFIDLPVLDGVPDHRDSVLDARARKAGDCMMICVSRACTPRLVLDL